MKFITYNDNGREQLAILKDNVVYRTQDLNPILPGTMGVFLEGWDTFLPWAEYGLRTIPGNGADPGIDINSVKLMAPVPHPPTCRDGYAFRRHVATARRGRGLPMIPEFDEYPVFYFTNPHTIKGPGEITCMPDHLLKLDFELEVAIVISRRGMNIRAKDADSYIAGYMIMNDFSARLLQSKEMLLNLGPAKGKDFATAVGPWMVTPDELSGREIWPKKGHTGKRHELAMTASVNGKQVSLGSMGDMDWTFAEIIERASYGVELFPGDIIGSGTVGTGCFMELNLTGKFNNADYTEQWLEAGDEIELEVEGLGVLCNTIVSADSGWRIVR